MFYKYEIINNGYEDILYLYLTMKYEFSKELILSENNLEKRTSNFIRTNNIKFKGNKVYLVVDGIIVKSVNVGDLEKYNSIFNVDSYMVNIKLDDSLCEISLREYLLSMLLSKYINNIHDEVFKAICVLYTTYAYKMMNDNEYIDTNNDFGLYKPTRDYENTINDYNNVLLRLNSIINEVDSIYIGYNEEYILPFMHYSNSGRTISNTNYPYLSSVKSLWDLTSPYYIESNIFSYDKLSNILNININNKSKFFISYKNNNKLVIIDNNIFTIEEFKKLLNLKSNDIYLIIYNNYLKVITKGFGNSLGLSIYGGNEIALNGALYSNILKYYFPKTKLYKRVKELS